MKAYWRGFAAFFLMLAIGYIGVVVLFPAPGADSWQPSDMSGPSAAERLSAEAHALVSRRPAASLVQ